jgi:serine/threonine-protein kinase
MNTSGSPERYRILRSIGRGGMGCVYSARDTVLERDVALKVVRPPDEIAGSESARLTSMARMIREARAAAALVHPNIVTVYDVGELGAGDGEEPSCFIAMELIEGKSLRETIGKADVPLTTKVGWLADVARALAFAHQHGIIHRDVKPDNVMIRHDGVVKVLDFGLARRAPGEATHASSQVFPTLTEEGKVLGTLSYMAPEQMGGLDLDGRADQFSWGVVAYELLAGRLPWPAGGDSIQVVAQMLTHDPVPLSDLAPMVPARLAAIVHRAVQRERVDRFESMQALLAALDASSSAMDDPSTTSSDGPPSAGVPRGKSNGAQHPPTKRLPWSLVLAAGAAGLAIVGSAWLGRARDPAHAATGDCATDGDCTAGSACSSGRCQPRSHCRSDQECTTALGEPAVCRPGADTCALLRSEDCRLVAEESDVANDATVWFGAMFPLTGEEAQSFGTREFEAVDLARSDFAHMLRGMNARSGGAAVHPLAIVACDDSIDASRAAHHLVDDVGVPAIIGFRTSKEVIDLATSLFLPRGVLTLAALNTSPVIASLPHAPGQPHMVFRTTYSSSQTAAPIGLLVSNVLEPEIRAERRTRPSEPLRVALVRQEDPAGIGFADSLFRTLRYNGRSALRNDANYREIAYPFDDGHDTLPDFRRIADELRAFAPHVVIHFGSNEAFLGILQPLERDLASDAPRPRYIKPNAPSPAVAQFVAASAERRRRFFSITSSSTTEANARFVTRYGEVYHENVSRTFSPNSSYDAFYLLAYATFALGAERVTGTALARAVTRLLPPGRPIEVGPSAIFDAFNTLSSGGHIDLRGATGGLDFDTSTGDAPVDLAVLCVGGDADSASSIESGLTYDTQAGALRGTLRCP